MASSSLKMQNWGKILPSGWIEWKKNKVSRAGTHIITMVRYDSILYNGEPNFKGILIKITHFSLCLKMSFNGSYSFPRTVKIMFPLKSYSTFLYLCDVCHSADPWLTQQGFSVHLRTSHRKQADTLWLWNHCSITAAAWLLELWKAFKTSTLQRRYQVCSTLKLQLKSTVVAWTRLFRLIFRKTWIKVYLWGL